LNATVCLTGHEEGSLSETNQYRITKNTIALLADEDGYVARPVEQGTCVEFDRHILLSAAVLVEVLWGNQTALMFATDLKSIAVQVGPASTEASESCI
jgi:hypothetical protein